MKHRQGDGGGRAAARPLVFTIRPDPPGAIVTREELQSLALQLGLVEHPGIVVGIVGDELRLTLTPLGRRAVEAAGR